ncbi:MAG: UvrD-helicase domain-containing protein [Chloroflexi bacterium]|nr:UvrD-helicase domain-containing protein [Chloroflexota bacterium]
MIRPRVILGPPGCGKTHRLLDLLCGELAGGTPPQRIAFVTFTRAARREALERIKARLGLGEEDMPWVRTIHSTAYRLLELAPGQLMDEELWGAFARRYGYRLSDCVLDLESPFEPPLQQTPEDRARYVHDWGRNCRLDPERALRRCPVEGVKATLYRQFVRRVEGFKREEGLLDFSDLLDQVLARGLRPPVEVLFVDDVAAQQRRQVVVRVGVIHVEVAQQQVGRPVRQVDGAVRRPELAYLAHHRVSLLLPFVNICLPTPRFEVGAYHIQVDIPVGRIRQVDPGGRREIHAQLIAILLQVVARHNKIVAAFHYLPTLPVRQRQFLVEDGAHIGWVA